MSSSGRSLREALPDAISRRLRREMGQRLLLMVLIAGGVGVVDQIVKVIIRTQVGPGAVIPLVPGVDIVHTVNTGIAFSLFSGSTGVISVLTLVAVAIVAVALVGFGGQHRLVPIGGGLLLGGSVGNLIDRVTREGVTDFIAIGAWPPFNVADIAVTAGALLLVVAVIRSGSDD
ncbi:MAG: signal peptidase II [Thermoleophilia bacterium]|nr:signal peptidase II [Thermoleophilia bacterium]